MISDTQCRQTRKTHRYERIFRAVQTGFQCVCIGMLVSRHLLMNCFGERRQHRGCGSVGNAWAGAHCTMHSERVVTFCSWHVKIGSGGAAIGVSLDSSRAVCNATVSHDVHVVAKRDILILIF